MIKRCNAREMVFKNTGAGMLDPKSGIPDFAATRRPSVPRLTPILFPGFLVGLGEPAPPNAWTRVLNRSVGRLGSGRPSTETQAHSSPWQSFVPAAGQGHQRQIPRKKCRTTCTRIPAVPGTTR